VWWSCLSSLFGYVEDLELNTVGVVEERRVVPREVRVLARLVLDRRLALDEPAMTFVDDLTRGRGEREVMDPEAVAVVLACGPRFGRPTAAPPEPPR
jgi:hypothetical protein